MPEVEQRGAGLLETRGFTHNVLDVLPPAPCPLPTELRPYGDSCARDRAYRFSPGLDLHHLRAAGPREHASRGHHIVNAARQVAADERARDTSSNRLAHQQHLIERDLALAVVPPHVHADGIAH